MSFCDCVRTFLVFHIAAASVIPEQSLFNDDIVNERPSFAEYMNQRQMLLNQEFAMGFESDVSLTANERLANEIIMRAKNKELREGLASPHSFNPSRHIFEVLNDVKNSNLFKIIEKMPKGGILHSHGAGICSIDFLVNLTYWQNLWQCTGNGTIYTFLFSRARPRSESTCTWSLVSEERQRWGAVKYDAYVREHFTLFDKNMHPRIQFRDVNDVWQRFDQIFERFGMLKYEPAWRAHFKQTLKEVYADNVQYLEFRSGLSPVRLIFIFHFSRIQNSSYHIASDFRFRWPSILRGA